EATASRAPPSDTVRSFFIFALLELAGAMRPSTRSRVTSRQRFGSSSLTKCERTDINLVQRRSQHDAKTHLRWGRWYQLGARGGAATCSPRLFSGIRRR